MKRGSCKWISLLEIYQITLYIADLTLLSHQNVLKRWSVHNYAEFSCNGYSKGSDTACWESSPDVVKIWLIFLLGLLWHPTLKGKGAPKIHRCLWWKRNDISQRVSKNLGTCISKLYTQPGNWDVSTWPPSINKWWWILNRGWDEIGKGEKRRNRTRKQTNITSPGPSINPSDGVSKVLERLWGTCL